MRMHPAHFRKVGIAPFGRRSLALRHGSCLLPLKLRFHPMRTTPISMPPARFGSYRVSVVITGFLIPAPSVWIAQSATARLPFHSPVATPDGCSGIRARSAPLDGGPPHWLTVATFGLCRLCPPHVPKPGTRGVTRFAAGFPDPHHLFERVASRCRSSPGSLVVNAGRNDPSRGSR
jgi:hypothetical protein